MCYSIKNYLRRFAVIILLLLSAAGQSVVAEREPALEPSQTFELARLGVVMIVTTIKTHVSVPEATLAKDKIPILQRKVFMLVRQGRIQNTPQAMKDAALQEIISNPLEYMVPSRMLRETDASTAMMGSGFFVTPNGYLVTNAHVVTPEENQVKMGLANQALTSFIHQDVQAVMKELEGNVSKEMQQQLANADMQYLLKYMTIGQIKKDVFTAVGVTVPGVEIGQKGIPTEVSVAGTPVPGKDVAVLKIENRTNLPTLPLGDDSTLKVTDPIYVIGYPGPATFNPMISSRESIEPTLTRGVLSRRVTMGGGWTALQTDASITHGNSGGPALDSKGNVIGLATFGSINSQGTQEVQGLNFLVPVSVVREFLSRINVQPQPSQVTKLYQQALVAASRNHYKEAARLFEQVNILFPGNPYVQQNISATQAAIMAGKDQPDYGWVATALLIIVVLALALGGLWFFFRRRLRPSPVTTAGTSGRASGPNRFCPNCGATLTAHQKFCGQCASPVSS